MEMGDAPPTSTRETETSLRLFGRTRLRVAGEVLDIEPSRMQALIGFLVLGGDAPQSREQVAFSLWPDSSEAQAKTNLRKALHGLRQIPGVDELIDVSPRSLRWRRELTDAIDVDAFESALEASASAGNGDDAINELARAKQLYTGQLLIDCWDEWLMDHRSRLAELHVSGLRKLAQALAAAGRVEEAARVGQEVVRDEPLQESSYRLLMDLYRASGDRAAAARVYHQCVRTLREELGVPPSDETTAAYRDLTDTQPEPTDALTRAGESKGALVGRKTEWDTLTSLWHDPGTGIARLVLVTGEPGIGKTHLVETFAVWAARRGAAVAQARSFPTEGELGFGLVIGWLRSPELRDTLHTLGDADRGILARLLPELGEPTDDISLGYAEHRRRLFDAIGSAFRRHARGRALVLVADDAQWTDEQSLQATQYMIRSNADAKLLVLATARREELAPDSSIERIAAELDTVGLATEVPLGRLQRPDSEALVTHLLGHQPTAAIDQLHADAEGNPLFIVEAIRAGWGPGEAGLPLSPRLRNVIGARVRQLSVDARALLDMAVTVGREFRVPVVQHASGLGDLDTVRALDELWRRGLINEYSVDAYDFTHGKIRDAVYEGLSPAVRRSNHRRLADALQELEGGSVDAVSGRVASHLDQGGDAEAAVVWYLRAADQAQRQYAAQEALRLLERALALAQELPEDRRLRRELDVLSALPTPLGLVEGFSSDRLVAIQERAAHVADEVGVELQPSMLRSLAFLRLCQNRYREGGELGRQLSSAAEVDGDRGLLLEGVYLEGIAAFWGGEFEHARDRFQRVVDEYTLDLQAEHLVRYGQDARIICRSRLANTLRFLGRVDEALATREVAVREATGLGHPWTLNLTLIFAFMLALDVGEIDRLNDYASMMEPLQVQSSPLILHTEAIVGATLAQSGQPEAGIAKIRSAIDACGPINPAPGFRPLLWRLLVSAHLAAGPGTGSGVAVCEQALQVEGSRIWWPDIERARQRFLSGR